MAVEYRSSIKQSSFIFTTVRDPSARAVSSIFFHAISRLESPNDTTAVSLSEATRPESAAGSIHDALILKELRTNTGVHYGAASAGQGGFQLRYTSFDSIPEYSAWSEDKPVHVHGPEQVESRVRRVLAGYNFVIVTERMEESLVCLALLIGADVGTVLVTSSKVAGSRYHFTRRAGSSQPECLPTVKSFVSDRVRSYLDSDDWKARNYGDYLLWQAANASLDLTIEAIGRDRFQAALDEYRRLRELEERLCAPHALFPCSDEGKPQTHLSKSSCYLRNYDFGCGYKCIDQMLLRDGAETASRGL
jgi:hypothetical protein